MAEDDDNGVLRLLREIRAGQDGQSRRLVRVGRRVDGRHEGMTTMGMAAHPNVAIEQYDGQYGRKFNEVEDQLAALRRRMSNLEVRK